MPEKCPYDDCAETFNGGPCKVGNWHSSYYIVIYLVRIPFLTAALHCCSANATSIPVTGMVPIVPLESSPGRTVPS